MNTADPNNQLTERRLWNARLEKRRRERAEAARRAAMTKPAAGAWASSFDLSKDLEIDSGSDADPSTQPTQSSDGAPAAAEHHPAIFSTPRPRLAGATYPADPLDPAELTEGATPRPRKRPARTSRRMRGLAWAPATIIVAGLAALVIHGTGPFGEHPTGAGHARASATANHQQRWSTKPLQTTLTGLITDASAMARKAAAQERRQAAAAAAAKARTRKVRQAAERRRAAQRTRARRQHSHRNTTAQITSSATTQPPESPSTTPPTTPSEATTTPTSSTGSSATSATTTSSSGSTHTPTHAFGQGGVLGVGHAG